MTEKKMTLDLTYLKTMSDGSHEFELEMLNMIIEQIPEAILRINELLAQKDWDMIRALAHKLKSSVGIFGLNELKDILIMIEKLVLDNGNMEEMPGMVNDLIQKSKVSMDALNETIKTYSNGC
ncbi:MAG: Hpt domain-containing protein [Bacteroidota bacterium]|nr:Hpt domain-containing protein [Bacteroidota bacterium]